MSKLITNDCVSSLVNNHIGKTDISDIGDGTITGAISGINARADALMKHAFSGVQTNAVLTDALSIDTGNPYGENNRCAYVSSWDGTVNMPYSCSFGVHEVSKCNTITIVRITGYTFANDAGIWINFYVNDHWLGWQSTLGNTLDWAGNTNGESFRYNFLNVDTTNQQSSTNRPSHWSKGFGESTDSKWVNIPPTMPVTATGYREVYWANPKFITVKITETMPDIGKQYYCRYGDNGWSDWYIVNSTVATS